MYLLDTNVISELRKAKAGKADPKVVAWAERISAPSLFLSVITLLELKTGLLLIERRNLLQGAILRRWLETQVYRLSLNAFSRLTRRLRGVAHGCMCLTRARTAMRSLPQRRWFTI